MTTAIESRVAVDINSFSRNFYPSPSSFSKSARVKSRSGRSMAGLSRNSAVSELEKEEDPFQKMDLPEKYTRTHWTLFCFLQWAAFFMISSALICSLTVGSLKKHLIWGMKLWRWLLVILLVFCGRLLSGWGVRLVMFFVVRNLVFRKKVLYFVYGLKNGVQNCLWLGIVLLAWNLLLDPKVEHSTRNSKMLSLINKLLYCLLIGSVIWLLKLLLVKVMASSFHVNTYFDRIHQSVYALLILKTLSRPQLYTAEGINLSEMTSPRELKGDTSKEGDKKKNMESEPFSVGHLHKLDRNNVSAWNMKRLISHIQNRHIFSLEHTIDESTNEDRESEEAHKQSETEAMAMAKEIFENVTRNGPRGYIIKEDLQHFFKGEDDVTKVWAKFDHAEETGKITKESLINWVVEAYKERKALVQTLNDTKTSVDELHIVLNIVVVIITIVISLLVLGIATTRVLLIVSSQLVLVGIMCGNACKQLFEDIIFLFIMHPYDVGDRCIIDGVHMVVEEMNLFSTVFLRYDNEKIYYPNYALSTKPISNLRRSPEMGETLDFSVHISTSMEQIDELKKEIIKYIEKNPLRWQLKHTLIVKEIVDMNCMRMSLWVNHTINFQNNVERWIRRTDLLLEMKNIFHKLSIEYHLLPQEVLLKHIPPSFYNHYNHQN